MSWISDYLREERAKTMKYIHAMNIGTAYAALNGAALGDIRFEDQKVYKMVQYKQGAATLTGAVGDFVGYYSAGGDATNTGYSTNQVTPDNSDTAGIGAGVLPAIATDGQYLWIQIKGPATLSTAIGGTPADGNPLTFKGAADRALTKAAEADSTGVYKPVCAVGDDVSAKTVALDCPF